MSEGYSNWEIHLFEPEDEDDPEELPARVHYAPLLQEDDFLDEDEELFSP
jgi:hypothetical protein